MPDGVPFDAACFATLGSIAMNGVRTGNVALGETVAVIGLGLVGPLTAQLARLQGGRVTDWTFSRPAGDDDAASPPTPPSPAA